MVMKRKQIQKFVVIILRGLQQEQHGVSPTPTPTDYVAMTDENGNILTFEDGTIMCFEDTTIIE